MKDYLVKPFMDTVNCAKFASTKNTMNIIRGVTGQGKTFTLSNVYIPYLIEEKGLKLIIVTVPTTEIIDIDDFISVSWDKSYIVTRDYEVVNQNIRNNKPTVLITTHQSLVSFTSGFPLTTYIKENSIPFALFIDEAHTWLISGQHNYKDVNGNAGSNYEATLFNLAQNLSVFSPYIFGITATPNAEQISKIDTIGTLKFKIINEMPDLSELISKTAWFNSIKTFNINSKSLVMLEYNNAITEIIKDNKETYIKKVMLVSTNRKVSKKGFTLEDVLDMTKHEISKSDINPADFTIAVMTGKPNETGVYNLLGQFTKLSQDEIKLKLNNNSDALFMLLVVNKGQMGMNVYNIKTLFSFKAQNKQNTDKEAITELAIQWLGRATRLNTGMPNNDFSKKYGYDLTNYIKTLNNSEIENIIKANSINIIVPSTTMWINAVMDFTKYYVSTTIQARAWISSIKG